MRLTISLGFYGILITAIFCCPWAGNAEETKSPEVTATQKNEPVDKNQSSIQMLNSINELKKNLSQRLSEKRQSLTKSSSEIEKSQLKAEIEKLDKQLSDAAADFERIATGIDISLFIEKKSEQFNWKDEVISLVEPGIMELKRMTVKARHKTKLKDEISYYKNRVPVARDAVEKIMQLISMTSNSLLKKNLKELLVEWKSVEGQLQNKLKINEMQLQQLETDEESLIATSQKSIKNFFRTRGLYLFTAFMACLAVIFLLRLTHKFFMRVVPGYAAEYRPFHVRLLDLCLRVFSVLLTFFILLLVFYSVEDWVLLSLSIIFLMGVGWTIKSTLPIFWQQSRFMLNLGSVREGERILYHGVPWLVKSINFFCKLENPFLEMSLRLPIEELLGKTSRTFNKNEPWFPCRKNDWVILSDGTRGKVTSLSHEMVVLVQRGGARKTYQTGEFLGLSPLNLSLNFRLKVPFGIGYEHQEASTGTILKTLQDYLLQRIDQENYKKDLLDFKVEFQAAGSSSLDIIVIADFNGNLAHLYGRLNRAIQRWCVDACTLNHWSIPFPQITVHQG